MAVAPPDAHRRSLYQGRVVDFGIETAHLPDGRQVELEVVRHRGAAAVVPLHDDGTVTLVRQWRHAGGGMHVEIPAGVLEEGETPLQCGVRELAEAVQLMAERWEEIGCIHTTPGFTDERIWLFAAHGLSVAQGTPEADEYIEVLRIPLAHALTMARDGRITDAKTICGLYLACTA